VSDTLGEGTTEYVQLMRSGYSSVILETSSVPIPDPVPPPRDYHVANFGEDHDITDSRFNMATAEKRLGEWKYDPRNSEDFVQSETDVN